MRAWVPIVLLLVSSLCGCEGDGPTEVADTPADSLSTLWRIDGRQAWSPLGDVVARFQVLWAYPIDPPDVSRRVQITFVADEPDTGLSARQKSDPTGWEMAGPPEISFPGLGRSVRCH